MKTNQINLYLIGTYLCIALLLSLLITGVGFAQDHPQFVRMAQKMEADKTGLSNPAGVVFSLRANLFHVVESRGNNDGSSGFVVIKDISVFGREAGSTRIKIGIDNPINMAMDNKFGRLLIYQATTLQLIEFYEDSIGDLDPNTLTVQEASSFGLQDPQGMTFDPIHGYLYFLDGVGPRLVRIMLQPDGSFTSSTIDVVNLGWASNIELRGIAFDPTSGNFHVVSPGEQRLYEFTNSGEVVAIRDLSEFNLSNPQGFIFAPSGDQTDNSMESSLYLADSGFPVNSQTELLSSDNSTIAPTPGKIVELSLVQPLEQIDADFTSEWVKTTDTAAFLPPSPDPSGLTYLSSSNRLLISDADVEETVGGITHFMGVNLWEVNLDGTVVNTANISPIPPTRVAMSEEPAGVTWNPANGHYYFSDDHRAWVYDLNPGFDGLYGTADDSWNSFSTLGSGNGDPEGIAYDTWNDNLFVSDGVNQEVYQYTLEGDLVNHFDVGINGITDPESVEFNPVSGTLFIIGNGHSHKIIETGISGNLLQTIDITAASSLENPAGLAYAPASDDSGSMHFYIVDRGIDNVADPNEIDGKMYEMTAPVPNAPGNTPPVVNAGSDQSIAITPDANLSGSATDDGLPIPPAGLTTTWSGTGPGSITFANPTAQATTACFSSKGAYVLRLTAYDGEFTTYDEINIFVSDYADSSVFEARVVTSNDDAEESNTGTVNLVSPDLELVFDGNNQTVGLRFNQVNIPKNAQINNAYIQFQVDGWQYVVTSLTIWGGAQDNPGTFIDTNQNISSRLRTSASVGWSPPEWMELGQAGVDQRTPNISPIIQELIARPGWITGNSLVFIIGGTGCRTATAYDKPELGPSGAPRLHVEYTLLTNHPPAAVNDSYTTNEDTQLSVNISNGVLKNDTDVDGDSFTAVQYTNPTHGTLILNPNGSFVYTPATNYNGSDSFTYYTNDGNLNSNIATVNLTIRSINDPPLAVDDTYTTGENTQLIIPAPGILSNDTDVEGDALSARLDGSPTHGTLNFNRNGSFRYTPDLNYGGSDSFTYHVRANDQNSNVATATITVTGTPNNPPVANNQSVTTAEDTLKAITLTATDVDGNPLTWAIVTPPAHGTLTGTAPALNYTPNLNYHGSDSFTFKVNDGTVDSNIATVTITVTPVNDAPVAVNDAYSMSEDTTLSVAAPGVLSNDSDVDGNTLTAILNSGPTHGTLTLNPAGSFVYTPLHNYNGSDSFTYHAYDGHLNSNIVTVTITVRKITEILFLPLIIK